MITYRVEVTIKRTINEVFPYVADPALHPQSAPVRNVQVAPPGEARVRTTVREMMKVGTRMAPFTTELRKRKDLLEGPT